MREEHRQTRTTRHNNNKDHSGICSLGQHGRKHRYVVGHTCTTDNSSLLSAMHIQSCDQQIQITYHDASTLVLVGANDRQARRSCLSATVSRVCLSLSNHSVIIKSSSSSTRVLGARRPTKNRETRHLGARRPTQAQSTLRPQALGARRPTKRTEALHLGARRQPKRRGDDED